MKKRTGGATHRSPPGKQRSYRESLVATVYMFGSFLTDAFLGGLAFLALLVIEGSVGVGVHAIAHLFGGGLSDQVSEYVHDAVIMVDSALYLWFVVISAVKTAKEHR